LLEINVEHKINGIIIYECKLDGKCFKNILEKYWKIDNGGILKIKFSQNT
jgi:hypothetical protein